MEEVTGSCLKLHTEELRVLYFAIIFRVTRSRRMKWMELLACVEKSTDAYITPIRKLKGKAYA
jgi:hypothetical protein